ncbi:zonadhesin-like [Mixophyes fleayi]|uniref:zonadhesin-like n=1 Tax=Mixophyes fleayi TaxID=3061075 RepID=UPI003F4D7C50
MAFASSQTLVQLVMLALCMSLIDQNHATPTRVPCPPKAFYGCKSPCFSNCDNLNSTGVCNKMCVYNCTCMEGYVFQSKNSDVCVPVSSCKVICPENMTFRECYRIPQETCETLGIHYEPSEKCMHRCVCNDGYVLSNEATPRCIKRSKCPKLN